MKDMLGTRAQKKQVFMLIKVHDQWAFFMAERIGTSIICHHTEKWKWSSSLYET